MYVLLYNSSSQQPKTTYPHPRIPAARCCYVFLCFPLLLCFLPPGEILKSRVGITVWVPISGLRKTCWQKPCRQTYARWLGQSSQVRRESPRHSESETLSFGVLSFHWLPDRVRTNIVFTEWHTIHDILPYDVLSAHILPYVPSTCCHILPHLATFSRES